MTAKKKRYLMLKKAIRQAGMQECPGDERIGGSDDDFRSESRGKNVVRDGNMDKND